MSSSNTIRTKIYHATYLYEILLEVLLILQHELPSLSLSVSLFVVLSLSLRLPVLILFLIRYQIGDHPLFSCSSSRFSTKINTWYIGVRSVQMIFIINLFYITHRQYTLYLLPQIQKTKEGKRVQKGEVNSSYSSDEELAYITWEPMQWRCGYSP